MTVYKSRVDNGFTIVELLIIIVVIGILAAITIVAYNGIQERAVTSATASTVKQYKNALIAYATEKGSYPIATFSACLGEGYPDNSCWDFNGSANLTPNTTLNNAIRPYMGNANPLPIAPKFVYTGTYVRGGFAFSYTGSGRTLDGVLMQYMLQYYVKGTVCPVGPVPTKTLNTYSSNNPNKFTEYQSSTNISQCELPLPNPGDL